MYTPIFSKRHKKLVEAKDPQLDFSSSTKRRILYAMEPVNTPFYAGVGGGYEPCMFTEMGEELVREHGWDRLRTYDASTNKSRDCYISDFLRACPGQHVLDAIELYSRKLDEEKPHFQTTINRIFSDERLPWILVGDMIFRIDSEYSAEVFQSASALLAGTGFDGALEEFQRARSHLDSGDNKESVHHANLSLESTMKSILGVQNEKPGKLIRSIVDSKIVPEYYDGFLTNFEQILRSVNVARNKEKGAGHGQGVQISEVPHPLAELVLNLCVALTQYLIRQHVDATSQEEASK